jgi:hypothetical protein
MIRILETELDLEYELGHHLHCLAAQIPVHLHRGEHGWVIADRERHWRTVSSVLDLVARGEGNFRKAHFVVFPESCVPVERLEEVLSTVETSFRPNTVTAFGLEHMRLATYRSLLVRFRFENEAALELVQNDVDSGDVLDLPVNACCIVVKDAARRLRVFLEAKTHPFRGEEFLDVRRDLYRGRHFWLFRSRRSCFNFMVLVCLDYLWRDLYASNVRQIMDHANRMFFQTRQSLDALFVIQANPKPEHRAYRDVLCGFYGEYLEDAPGVRETVTVFGNCSEESVIEGYDGGGAFGVSQVIMGRHHKLARVATQEFSTDDMGGAPLCRLRFGTDTRLYYFNLPLHHELDPRSTRLPLKVHSIMNPVDGGWEKLPAERIAEELAADDVEMRRAR